VIGVGGNKILDGKARDDHTLRGWFGYELSIYLAFICRCMHEYKEYLFQPCITSVIIEVHLIGSLLCGPTQCSTSCGTPGMSLPCSLTKKLHPAPQNFAGRENGTLMHEVRLGKSTSTSAS